MAQQMQRPASELHIREAHAAIMSSNFVILMPGSAMLVYLPASQWQYHTFTAYLAIAGLVLGVHSAVQTNIADATPSSVTSSPA